MLQTEVVKLRRCLPNYATLKEGWLIRLVGTSVILLQEFISGTSKTGRQQTNMSRMETEMLKMCMI